MTERSASHLPIRVGSTFGLRQLISALGSRQQVAYSNLLESPCGPYEFALTVLRWQPTCISCGTPVKKGDPTRTSVWEIHPVYKIEVEDTPGNFITFDAWVMKKGL